MEMVLNSSGELAFSTYSLQRIKVIPTLFKLQETSQESKERARQEQNSARTCINFSSEKPRDKAENAIVGGNKFQKNSPILLIMHKVCLQNFKRKLQSSRKLKITEVDKLHIFQLRRAKTAT